jgi:hypothetical protein
MSDIVDVASAIVLVAAILVLTRQGSQGPALVQNLTAGFSNALGVATGSNPSGVVSYAS